MPVLTSFVLNRLPSKQAPKQAGRRFHPHRSVPFSPIGNTRPGTDSNARPRRVPEFRVQTRTVSPNSGGQLGQSGRKSSTSSYPLRSPPRFGYGSATPQSGNLFNWESASRRLNAPQSRYRRSWISESSVRASSWRSWGRSCARSGWIIFAWSRVPSSPGRGLSIRSIGTGASFGTANGLPVRPQRYTSHPLRRE